MIEEKKKSGHPPRTFRFDDVVFQNLELIARFQSERTGAAYSKADVIRMMAHKEAARIRSIQARKGK